MSNLRFGVLLKETLTCRQEEEGNQTTKPAINEEPTPPPQPAHNLSGQTSVLVSAGVYHQGVLSLEIVVSEIIFLSISSQTWDKRFKIMSH